MALFEAKKIIVKSMQVGKIYKKGATDCSTGDIVFGNETGKEKVEKKIEINPLPPVLATTQALEYWHKAQEAGWIDENYQLLISNPKAALLADYIGRKIGLVDRWVPFTQLWGIKNLSKDFDRANFSKEGGIFIDLMNEKLN